jgi:hypothetical protein
MPRQGDNDSRKESKISTLPAWTITYQADFCAPKKGAIKPTWSLHSSLMRKQGTPIKKSLSSPADLSTHQPIVRAKKSPELPTHPKEETKLSPLKKSQPFEVDFEKIIKIKQQIISSDYIIPKVWPDYLNQRGPTCGLYALATALQYSHPLEATPPARKDGQKNIVSLREAAKKMGFTAFGEIFDVESLSHLANYFGYPNCESSHQAYMTKQNYINAICHNLKKGGTVIVACDIDKNGLPTNAKGLATHWALIFGYFFSATGCCFLVHQYGKKYIWSAEDLYQSNLQLPYLNPKRGPHFFYYKNKEKELEEFKEAKLDNANIPNTLSKFRFGMCYVGSSVRMPLLDFTAAIEDNQTQIVTQSMRPI